jgi:dihydroflavonol-4-reductase
MALVRRFLQGRIPIYVDGGLNVVDVRDVAVGHLLADERGEAGERYILAGRNFTLDRLFADLARISGVSPPATRLPISAAVAGVEAAALLRLPVAASRDEVRSGGLWWTYRNTKAKRELGFAPRPHEETLEAAVQWQMDELGDRVRHHRGRAESTALGMIGRVLDAGERLASIR